MSASIDSKPGVVKNRTTVERKSDREVVVTRTINGPARIVFEAFTKAELLKRWWVPKSMGMTLLSCEVDARVGGKYRLVFDYGGSEPAAFLARISKLSRIRASRGLMRRVARTGLSPR
jgi:Uncharacterized conserved protein